MGLAALCVRRPVFTAMMILALAVLGIISFRELGVDLYPRVEFPTVTITTALPGAGAEEIESEVTKPIEEAVNTIQGIDELRSVSREGVSTVIITFLLERDVDQATQDVRDKVAAILRQLPEGVDPPVIERMDPDAAPVMSISLSGERSLREITEIADKQLKQQLESVRGVGQVALIGGRERAIQVEVDADRLNALGVSITQVAAALRRQNVELPSGRLDQGPREIVVRTLGRIPAAQQFADVIVATRN
ncbi:MAG: efflux RND transporter permease subunit, partial [Terriglobia bacterium]